VLLSGYHWPGNVRELENAIESAVVFAQGEAIEPRHLPPELTSLEPGSSLPPIPGAALEEIERHAILTALEATGGSTSKAAKMLGVSVRMIQYRLQRYSATPRSSTPRPKSSKPSSREEEPNTPAKVASVGPSDRAGCPRYRSQSIRHSRWT